MKNKILIILSLFVLLLVQIAQAHEFWLMSQKFIFQKDETVEISFWVGENFEGEPWQAKSKRMQKMTHHTKDGATDIKYLFTDTIVKPILFKLEKEGSQLFVLNSDDNFIELEAEKFNAYLQEDGLFEIIAWRKKKNQDQKPGRELYQRCAKLLLQVGNKQDETYKENTAMALEIIPLENPYFFGSDSLRVKILFKNKPLKSQLIKIWNRVGEQTFIQDCITNDKGEILFKLTQKGRWMISTVKMIPHSNPKEADWHSFWGSYTWGYD